MEAHGLGPSYTSYTIEPANYRLIILDLFVVDASSVGYQESGNTLILCRQMKRVLLICHLGALDI